MSKNQLQEHEKADLSEKIKQFQDHVPLTDLTLTILKAHLVIERTLLEFIRERVNDEVYKEIEKQRDGAYSARVLFAQALSGRDEVPCLNNDILWPALKQLGLLRNT